MQNVWIIHNSKFGNSKKLSEEIALYLREKYKVKIYNIRTQNIEDTVLSNPYALIIGVRIIMFSADKKISKFLKELSSQFNKHKPKIAIFFTHSAPWTKRYFNSMTKDLQKISCYSNIFPKYLEISIKGQKGPIKSGQDLKIQNYIKELLKLLEL